MEDGSVELTRGKRRRLTTNAINRQKRIAKMSNWNHKTLSQPHRWAKKHAMDCGRPGCMVCGNPRRTMKEKTLQEKKFAEAFQASRGELADIELDMYYE
jgi:hypothetical protein